MREEQWDGIRRRGSDQVPHDPPSIIFIIGTLLVMVASAFGVMAFVSWLMK